VDREVFKPQPNQQTALTLFSVASPQLVVVLLGAIIHPIGFQTQVVQVVAHGIATQVGQEPLTKVLLVAMAAETMLAQAVVVLEG
jgi:hypothetical protein